MTLNLPQIIDLTGEYAPGWTVPHARRKDLLAERFTFPAARQLAAARIARMQQVGLFGVGVGSKIDYYSCTSVLDIRPASRQNIENSQPFSPPLAPPPLRMAGSLPEKRH